MDKASFKIAFIGSHGVGKTTLCYGLAARLKSFDFSLDVVHEVARRCPLPINQRTNIAAQSWIIHTQIAEELVATERYGLVICDRSVLDNYIYLKLSFGRQPSLEQLIFSWTRTYDLLVHVPISSNPNPDGIRSTDPAFQLAIHENLVQELENRHLETLSLVNIDRGDWLNHVLQAVQRRLRPKTQLELL